MTSRAWLLAALLVVVIALGVGGWIIAGGVTAPERGRGALVGRQPTAEALPEPAAGDAAPATVADPVPLDETVALSIVEGHVRDEQGRPLPFADVAVYRFDAEAPAAPRTPLEVYSQTNEDGRYLFLDLPDGETLGVEVRYEGLAPAFTEPFTPRHGARVLVRDTVLRRGLRLVGTVRSPSGRGLYGARVTLFDASATPPAPGVRPPEVVVVTDTTGAYAIPNLARRHYRLRAELEGYGPVSKTLAFVLDVPTPEWRQDFVLAEADSLLAGRVVDREGRPLPGARVTLSRRRLSTQTVLEVSATTGADGRFRFEPLPGGKAYDVEVELPGHYLASRDSLSAGREDHELHLLPALAIQGRLVTGAPLPDEVEVTVVPDASSGAGIVSPRPATRTFSQRETPGLFLFDDLRPGSYAFEIRAEGFAPTRSPTVTIAATTPFVETPITLFSGGEIRGRLVGPDGEPAAGAPVELRHADYDPALAVESVLPTRPIPGLVARTGDDGRFALARVPPGTYALSLRPPGAAALHVRDLEVVEAGVADLGTLRAEPGGVLAGLVRDESGAALPGARVSASGATHHAQVLCDEEGRFELTGLPAGDYDVLAVPSDLWKALRYEARGEATVATGQTAEVELELALRSR